MLGNAVNRTATTDSTGRYTFSDVVPGTYRITQTQPAGYLDGQEQNAETGSFPPPTIGNDVFSNIILANEEGQDRGDFNFGELTPASIGDFVWNDTNYNGRQDAGEPGLAGVRVRLSGTDDLGNSVIHSVLTDASGNYTFSNLRPGTYQVTFVAPNSYQFTFQNASIATTETDSDANPATGQTAAFTLMPGQQDSSWDAGLFQLINGSISGFVWMDANNNGIREVGEPAIPGTIITLTGTDVLGNGVNRTTTTGANGRYTFANVVPGTYTITQTQPVGYLDGQEQNEETGSLPPPTISNDAFSDIILSNGQNRGNFNFGELAPASIGDYVWNDKNRDGLQEIGEIGFGNITVNLIGTDDLGNAVMQTTQTDANGLYRFNNLRPGTYRVQFVAPPLYEFTIPNSPIATDETDSDANPLTGLTEPFSLGVGQIDLSRDAGFFLGTVEEGGIIRGWVWIDDNNNGIREPGEGPIANVQVILTGVDVDGNNINRTTFTNAEGLWGFTNLLPGTYTATEVQPIAYRDGKEENAETGNFPPPTINPDQFEGIILVENETRGDFNFGELAINSSISGWVYVDRNNNADRDAGEPGIAGVLVTLTGTDIEGNPVSVRVRTNANGKFSFIGMLPGTYTLTQTQPARFPDGRDTAGSAGGDVGNDVISNIVIGSNVAAVNYLFGEGLPRTGPISKRALLANGGGIAAATPGTGLARANQLSSLAGSTYIDANNNGRRDPGEIGIAGVRIQLRGTTSSGQQVFLVAVTDADGRFSFNFLSPGIYSLIQIQPDGVLDGKDKVGNQGGRLGNNSITNINLKPNRVGVGYHFGQRRLPVR